jgi:hypothetical protein
MKNITLNSMRWSPKAIRHLGDRQEFVTGVLS